MDCYPHIHFLGSLLLGAIQLQRQLHQTIVSSERGKVCDSFCSCFCLCANFIQHIRMTHDSFTRLLSAIWTDIEVDTEMAELWGGAILPEICLYVSLCYLGGGFNLRYYILRRYFSCVLLPSSVEGNWCNQQEHHWNIADQVSSKLWWRSWCCIGFF